MTQNPSGNKLPIIPCTLLAMAVLLSAAFCAFAENPGNNPDGGVMQTSEEGAWTGIDVSIVGKYASKYGRPPRDPYINTDQGDLLLFVFTLAGVDWGVRHGI
ncbi:MAG: hypothetical protein BROFUL_02822 [Candidatus Brocadia fulgida]|uniref:Uncharacterized protein n=1 Tax=Candidatus Brocadia fulgida TaxID=380242 RepID=A0A0M2UQY5_9BACT|nr:MAG: hypothetical protein BROFUL_02822 [Candidatus Brocadia fulgida]